MLRQGAGSALLQRPGRIKEILTALREVVDGPLTVKIRSGIDAKRRNYLEILQICEGCGIDAITVHARTQRQGYSGTADWGVIKEMKMRSTIPVIGNGDVFCAEDALQRFEQTGCDGVMVGRGALGNPAIFSDIGGFLGSGKTPGQKTKEGQLASFSEYLVLAEKYNIKQSLVKKQALYFLRGFDGSVKMRSVVESCAIIDAMKKLIFGVDVSF